MKSSFDDSSSSPVFHALSLETVRAALDRAGCKPTPSGSGYAAFCPVHEADGHGHTPSLSVNPGDKQPVVIHCHAGCAHGDILAALDLKPAKPVKAVNGKRKIVATYSYCDLSGIEVRQKIRYAPKDFRIRHQDADGNWVYKAGEGPAVLYRLPELNRFGDVFFCEGEKDVDRLAALGLCATCNIEGAAQPNQKPKWRPEYTQQLAGAERLILLPDNDDAGRAHMRAIAKAMRGKVGEIRWLELQGLPGKGDVSDWLDAAHSKEELLALMEDAPVIGGVGQEQQPDQEQQQQPDQEQQPQAQDAPLVWYDQRGAHLVSHQEAAAIISKTFTDLRYDIHQQAWRHYDPAIGVFRLKPNLLNEATVYKKIRELSDDFPFSAAYVSGVAKCLLWETATELNQPPGFICFKNGVLDLRTLELLPHSAEYAFTAQLPFDWEPESEEPEMVLQWMKEAVGGHDDQVQLLRAYLNAIVTGRPDLQRYLELIGHGGSGKGTFMRLAIAILGEQNTHSTTIKQLEENRFETAKLYGKKLVVVTDAEKWHGDISTLKAITGQDPIRFEQKHQQAGDLFTYGGMVMILANQDVDSTDYSSGIQRRRITVRFDHVVPAHQRRDLDDEFRPYLPAVLRWVLMMPRTEVTRYLRTTSSVCPSLRNTRLETLAATNSVAAWMIQNVVYDPNAITKVGSKRRVVINTGRGDGDHQTESRVIYEFVDQWLYPNFVQFCEESGKKPVALNAFSSSIEDVARNLLGWNIRKKVTVAGSHIHGLRLRANEEPMRNYEEPMRRQVIDNDELEELSQKSNKNSESSSSCYADGGQKTKQDETQKNSANIGGKVGGDSSVPQVHHNQQHSTSWVPHSSSSVPHIVPHQAPHRSPDAGSHSAPTVATSHSPIAQTVIATLTGTPKSREELERLVSHAHGKAGPALIGSAINHLMMSGAIAPVGGLLHAVKAAKEQRP